MNDNKKSVAAVSLQALYRMPYYLQYLRRLQNDGTEVVSAPEAAYSLRLNEVQVRKDFAAVSTSKGKPKVGFLISELVYNIEDILRCHNIDDAVLVGAGSLGRALLSYKGFAYYGMNIAAAFDTDESLIGGTINGKKILSAAKLSDLCRRMNIHIGIITVPFSHAQKVCDQLVAGGVLAVWNFAPVRLSAPDGILIQNENMAASLAVLSKHLQTSKGETHRK